MSMLLNVPITTAVTAQVGTVYQLRSAINQTPDSLAVQGTCAGTLGTSMQWWLQTSFDGGTTWCDGLTGFHAAAGRLAGIVMSNPSAGAAPAAVTDGTLSVGTSAVQNGVFAGLWRVKYTTVGTWTLGNLRIDVYGDYVEPSTG